MFGLGPRSPPWFKSDDVQIPHILLAYTRSCSRSERPVQCGESCQATLSLPRTGSTSSLGLLDLLKSIPLDEYYVAFSVHSQSSRRPPVSSPDHANQMVCGLDATTNNSQLNAVSERTETSASRDRNEQPFVTMIIWRTSGAISMDQSVLGAWTAASCPLSRVPGRSLQLARRPRRIPGWFRGFSPSREETACWRLTSGKRSRV